MMLALLVALACFADPSVPVQIAAVKHADTTESEIMAGDAQCCDCPCWIPPRGECGCSVAQTGCSFCGYYNISEFPIPWGPFGVSDADGCVDMDLLPVPQDGWAYWVSP